MKQLCFLCLCFISIVVKSQQTISAISTTYKPAPGISYTANGATFSSLSANVYNYNYGFNSGTSNNDLVLNSITSSSTTYTTYDVWNQFVRIRRVNNSEVSGDRTLLYYEGSQTNNTIDLLPRYTNNMDKMYDGFNNFNAGTDNLFANQGDGNGNNNNIERLDVIFPTGIKISNLNNAGISIFDRGMNDPIKVAVILSLNGDLNPVTYTSIINIIPSNFAQVLGNKDYFVLRMDENESNLMVSTSLNQPVGGTFIKYASFSGLTTNTTIYGYSLIPNDFSGNSSQIADFTNSTYYPTNTGAGSGDAGGIDLVTINGAFKTGNVIVVQDNDIDDDDDGIPDLIESFGYNATGDHDGDGLPNFKDSQYSSAPWTDSNADGINDYFDIDLDGIINQFDLDSDNDGIPDIVEAGAVDTNGDGIIDGSRSADSDGDGLLNQYDATTGGINIANWDTDGDGIKNYLDLDSDNDGIPDVIEAGGTDANNDGIIDSWMIDDDKDGFADEVDGYVDTKTNPNNSSKALIRTGLDTNTDGIPDTYPYANTDRTGKPNPYDLDSDGDGITDLVESGLTGTNGIASGTLNANGWSENIANTNLSCTGTSRTLNFNSTAISSGRFIWFNAKIYSVSGMSSPTTITFDNQVITFTANSVNYSLSVPKSVVTFSSAISTASTFFDASINTWVINIPYSQSGEKFLSGLSYPVPVNFPGSISNVKWSGNIYSTKSAVSLVWKWSAAVYTSFSTNMQLLGIQTVSGTYAVGTPVNYRTFVTSGAGGTGGTNYTGTFSSNTTIAACYTKGMPSLKLRNTDGRGPADYLDIDSDDDGISDNVEGQPTYSYKVPTDVDTDGDGLADVYEISPSGGHGGSGITPYNHDGDGTPDYRDLDTDNDGVSDANEGSKIFGNFITNFNDVDGDGMIDQFDTYNITTATTGNKFKNVGHNQMGPFGNLDGPTPSGSTAQLPKSQIIGGDRDWRNLTILPLNIVTFNVQLQKETAVLIWNSKNESNINYYVIEKSYDASNFSNVGQVNAFNTANADYQFNHALTIHDENKTIYFRIKQVNNDGKYYLTQIISLKLQKINKTEVTIYPNPVVETAIVKIISTKNKSATLSLFNSKGQIIQTMNIRVLQGENNFNIPYVNRLSSGQYYIQINDTEIIKSIRFIKN